jgi:diamine N-acetyltransferase
MRATFFENNHIILRAVEPEDLELLYLWENDTQLWSVGNTRIPYSKFALKQYIAQSHQDIYESKQLRLMIVDISSNVPIGTVDLFDFEPHHSRIAFGLFVAPQHQGKGIAKMALSLLEDYVFSFLKINQLYCHIAASNTASRTMFEQQNYLQSGYLHHWIKTINGYEDIIVFQLLNNQNK